MDGKTYHRKLFPALLMITLPVPAFAASDSAVPHDFTGHWAAWLAIALFVGAYLLVILEESIHLRKSKPVIVAAGFIWAIVALLYGSLGDTHTAETMIRHNLLEFAELFLFLLAAMTYINTMDERGVFDSLRAWLITRGFSLRAIFWVTGLLAFFISPVADNLTTALLMATVIMAVGGSNHGFVAVACINIVVAANAGGAFSPFGDITTLMVWQKGLVRFEQFFALFIPSVVNWLIPAIILSLAVPKATPAQTDATAELRYGAWVVVGLFILTIVMAVSSHNFLHLPPVIGMMTGLGFLKLYSYYLERRTDALGTFQDTDFSSPALDPFGDITTLMVWQKGLVRFEQFFALFIPSVVNWLIPAIILSLAVPKATPAQTDATAELRYGAWVVVGLFILTIVMAVSSHNFLHLPPVIGMMTGLGFLKLYSYYLERRTDALGTFQDTDFSSPALDLSSNGKPSDDTRLSAFNVFRALERAEWDTLMFFYGIILCVGGLGALGYLAIGSQLMYTDLGPTTANILVGILSAIVDNIPVMFAVLAMQPDMELGQWLLVTLTAGVGGSLLSIGSAAGVAVMGQARGIYTFFAHLKWSWAIALGYAASIWVHFLINANTFQTP